MPLEGGVVGPPTATFALKRPGRQWLTSGRRGSALCSPLRVGVQIRIAGPAVPVGKRRRDQTTDVDLPDPLSAGPGEQCMLLDEPQRVVNGGSMGLFNHRRHPRVGDRPQRRHRLHRRERQVIPGDGLGTGP